MVNSTSDLVLDLIKYHERLILHLTTHHRILLSHCHVFCRRLTKWCARRLCRI